jgi:hypothetical protein
LFLTLPEVGTAEFLWETPLFAVEGKKLTLHLGVPEGKSDEEVAARYREMGFGGLSRIYIHCSSAPRQEQVDIIQGRYNHLKLPPVLESVVA